MSTIVTAQPNTVAASSQPVANFTVKPEATYSFDYALDMARQAVNFAESEGSFSQVRRWLNEIEKSYNADMDKTVIVVSELAEVVDEYANLRRAPKKMTERHPELFRDDLGTRTIVSGGEVMELGRQTGSDEIPF